MQNSRFVDDTEIDSWVNDAIGELYDLLLQANDDYWLATDDFTITSGNTEPLPTDLYLVKGVDLVNGSVSTSLSTFTFRERNDVSRLSYRPIGSNLELRPAQSALGRSFRLYYVRTAPLLSDASQTLDAALEPWKEFLVVSAAIQCRAKQESDVSLLVRQRDDLLGRISSAAERDIGEPEHVTDVYAGEPWSRSLF